MIRVENFMNGKFIPASQFLDSFDPSTGKVHAQIPRSGKSDVEAAVAAADNARKGWSSTPVATRSLLMMKVADLLEANLDMFAKAESKDQGKPISLSRAVDIPRAEFDESEVTSGNLFVNDATIAPAIAAGNCVICKPSELTSVTAWMLCSIFNEAGIPPGVINMVFGSGAEVGAEIVENPNICAISFTGSTGVGHYIQEKSAPFCKKLSLELGGKNSAIVFDDANLDACIQTCVRSSFANQGEICLCTSRIYVHRSIFDTFIKRFVEKTRSLKVGPPENDVFMGALVSKDHLEKVKRYVQLAIEEGGTILCGEGKDELPDLPDANKQGYFMLPTAVMGLADDARCMQEEVFGPFVCITQFDTEEEVIKRVNNVTYGLCSTLWTESGQRIHRVAPQLEVGTIWCNCWLVRDLNMPFGGFKQSGIGREGFKDSLEFYTEVKTICVKTSY
eukprot:gene18349-20192_t